MNNEPCPACHKDCGWSPVTCKMCGDVFCGETDEGEWGYCESCLAVLLTWEPCSLCGAKISQEHCDSEYIQMVCSDCGLCPSYPDESEQTIEEWVAFWNRRPEKI